MAQQQKVSGVTGHGGAPLQSPRRKPNPKGVGEEATSDMSASVGRCCFPSCLCHGVGSMLLCLGLPWGLCLGLKPQKVMPGNGGQEVMALAWAAWYITRLLLKLTPKGVVFSFLSDGPCIQVDLHVLTLPAFSWHRKHDADLAPHPAVLGRKGSLAPSIWSLYSHFTLPSPLGRQL